MGLLADASPAVDLALAAATDYPAAAAEMVVPQPLLLLLTVGATARLRAAVTTVQQLAAVPASLAVGGGTAGCC
jgi:hypothetical protein